jgi:hypothetical protein
MCLNVFIDIIIGILPSHSHCNVFTMHTLLQIFFSLYTMTPFGPFQTCYTTTLFLFHSHWSVPTFIQSMKKLYINFYFMSIHHPTFHIPHSISSLVVWSIEEPKLLFTRYWWGPKIWNNTSIEMKALLHLFHILL